jgi:hypothetical protein
MPMDDSTQSGGTIAIPTPANPALDAAKAELTKMISDPTHPDHLGYLRNDPQVRAKIAAMYKTAVPETTAPGTPPAATPGREPDQAPTMTLEDRAARTEADAMVREALGPTYEADIADVEHELRYLTSDEQGQRAYQVFASRIGGLGPRADVLTVKYLRDLRKLRKGGPT